MFSTIRKSHFNHRASSPEALHNFAQNFGHLRPELSVNSAHVLGHPCSCTRAQILVYVGTSSATYQMSGCVLQDFYLEKRTGLIVTNYPIAILATTFTFQNLEIFS